MVEGRQGVRVGKQRVPQVPISMQAPDKSSAVQRLHRRGVATADQYGAVDK